MRRRRLFFFGAAIALSAATRAAAADFCDAQPSEIAKARCQATKTNRNIPEDVARAEASPTHIGWVYWAVISPDGTLLASAGKDQTVKLWEFATGRFIRNLGKHDGWVRRVAFRPDGKAVYAIADNEGLTELDAATGRTLRTIPLPPGEHKQWFRMALSRDGRFIALAGLEHFVLIWDVASWSAKQRVAAGQSNRAIVFEPTKDVLFTSGDSAMQAWDPETGERAGDIPVEQHPSRLAFSPDGSRLAVGGDKTVEIWNLDSGKTQQTLPTKQIPQIFDLAITPDNSILITCNDAPAAFDIATGRPRGQFGEMTDNCHSVAITSDGRYVVTSHNGADIRVWEIGTGAFVRRFGEPGAQP